MRFWEIDAVRGVAVILMIVFHVLFDLYYFGKITLNSSFLYFFPRFIGGMFIFISGFTTTVIYGSNFSISRIIRKTLKLGVLAVLITCITFLFVPNQCVVFGIIHFFTLATILSIIFLNRFRLCLFTGIITFLLGLIFENLSVPSEVFVWIGLKPDNFSTLDYYPLFPWLGIFLAGMYFGKYHYPFQVLENSFIKLLTFLGRNSLKIYVIQHPLILAFMQLIYGDIIEHLNINFV